MINVIERHVPPKPELPKHKVKCPHCKSILEYTVEDEQSSFHMDGMYGMATDYNIICPVCDANVPTRSWTEQGGCDWRIKE